MKKSARKEASEVTGRRRSCLSASWLRVVMNRVRRTGSPKSDGGDFDYSFSLVLEHQIAYPYGGDGLATVLAPA